MWLYLPWKFGARFSRNADTPSFLSCVSHKIANNLPSYWRPSRSPILPPLLIASLANFMPKVGFEAILLPIVTAFCMSSSNGTTWTVRVSPTTNHLYGGVCDTNHEGEKEFVVVGASGKIISSSDGTSWSTISPPSITTGKLTGVARGNKTWVLVGHSGYISSILDGESDVTTRTSGTSEHLRRVFYKP